MAQTVNKKQISAGYSLFLTAISIGLCGVSPLLIKHALVLAILAYGAAGACIAFVYYVRRQPLVFLYVIPAYALAFLISRSFFVSALSVLSLPLSLILLLCVYKGKGKAQTIAVMTGGFTAFSLAVIAAIYYAQYGSIDIPRLIGMAQNGFREQFEAANQLYLQMAGVILYSENAIEEAVISYITKLPSLYVLVCMAASYLCVLGFTLFLKSVSLLKSCFPNGYEFKASFQSAVVYMIFYFILLLFSEDAYSVAGVCASNITTLLTPLMTIIGVKAIFQWLKKSGAGSMGCLIFLLVPLIIMLQTEVVIALASAIGVVSIISGKIITMLKNKK